MNEQIDAVLKANGEALENAEQLSSAECVDLLNATAPCRIAIEERREAIWPARTRGSVGPIRAKALRTGTAEEIAALDDEFDALEIRWQKVTAQIDALSEHRERARDREASMGLPDLHAQLLSKLDKAETARDALMLALGELDAGFDAVYIARTRALKAGLHAPGADADTASRLERFTSRMDTQRLRAVTQFGKELRETLGIDAGEAGDRWAT